MRSSTQVLSVLQAAVSGRELPDAGDASRAVAAEVMVKELASPFIDKHGCCCDDHETLGVLQG